MPPFLFEPQKISATPTQVSAPVERWPHNAVLPKRRTHASVIRSLGPYLHANLVSFMLNVNNPARNHVPESTPDLILYTMQLNCDIRAELDQSRALLRESREILREISSLNLNYEYPPVALPGSSAS